jgi:hypothetical protein
MDKPSPDTGRYNVMSRHRTTSTPDAGRGKQVLPRSRREGRQATINEAQHNTNKRPNIMWMLFQKADRHCAEQSQVTKQERGTTKGED